MALPAPAPGRSDADICNLALLAIGHTKTIGALTERSEEARACNELYATCLDEVLESFDWPFATGRAKPAQLVATTLDMGAVPSGWAYAYALPSDCVPNGLRRVYPGTRNPRSDEETPHAIEHDLLTDQVIILTDDNAPELVYTRRIANTAKFSATFSRAVAERIAVDLIRALRKDLKLIPTQLAAYGSALSTAMAAAKKGERPDQTPPPSWIANR